jgi:ribosome-associated protein
MITLYKAVPTVLTGFNMTPQQLCELVIHALEDVKGIDIVTIDVRTLTTMTDFMIICSGTSNRHINALAQNVANKAKEHQAKNIRLEGEADSEWILVDLNDIVVHVMLPATRAFYSLEDLWEPVREIRENQSRG